MKKTWIAITITSTILICITILFLMGIKVDIKLSGVTIKTERPIFNVSEIMNGNYQKQYEDWFSENLPLRGYLLRTYNQFRYSLFKDTNADIIIGKKGYLFETPYVESFYGIVTADKEVYKKYASDLKAVQDKLEGKGKKFMYILTPSKAEFYEEYIPSKYRILASSKRDNNHKMLVEAFEEYGVNYYDTSNTIGRIKKVNTYIPFFKTGTHWNYYAAAESIPDIFMKLKSYYGDFLFPEVSISNQKQPQPAGEDQDLLKLLNIWRGVVDNFYYDTQIKYTFNEDYIKKNAFLFSTSFSHQLMEMLDRDDGVFNELVRYNYLQRKEITIDGKRVQTVLDNNIFNKGIEEMLDENDFIFIESNVQGVPFPHLEFVEYARKYLDGTLDKVKSVFTEDDVNVLIEVNNYNVKAKNNEEIRIPVKVINKSSTLMSSLNEKPIFVAYHIIDSSGNKIVHDGRRSPLPNDIGPGEFINMDAYIDVPNLKGNYTIELSIVQEGVMWLENYNHNLPVKINLTVVGGN